MNVFAFRIRSESAENQGLSLLSPFWNSRNSVHLSGQRVEWQLARLPVDSQQSGLFP